MIDAVGNPQSLLLLGGTSDIALAIAEKYLAEKPLRVVLAARPSPRLDAAAQRLKDRGAEVSTVDFDAKDTFARIEKAYGGWRGKLDEAPVRREQRQTSHRRATVAWKSPTVARLAV